MINYKKQILILLVLGFSLFSTLYCQEYNKPIKLTLIKKNIVAITQDFFDESDCIYIIEKNYDLNGKTIIIPKNSILFFKNGSFRNGTIEGNNCSLSGNLEYNIFNNTNLTGFNLGYIDVRWFGAISDFDPIKKNGTDIAPAIQKALQCSNQHSGTPILIKGSYFWGSSVVTKQDVSLFGYHNSTRILIENKNNTGYKDKSPSFIYVAKGINALVLEGTGNSKATAAHFYAKGLKLRSDGGVFAQIKTFGAPSRLGLFENIEAVGFKIVLSFNPENLDSQYGTIYGNFHINDCNIYECQQFIYAKGKDDLKPSLCNLKIENSVIEHGGKNQIELNNIFGYTEISNNILEGQEIPISVSIQKGHLSIIGNYFEQNGICANIQGLSPDLSSVSFSNNFFHENDPNINLTNLTIDFSTQDGIKRTKINTINCVSKDNTILLNDKSSSLTISGSKQKIPSLKPGMKLIEIGSETIGNDIYGKKTLDTKLTFLSEINISIKKGDILLLSFYKSEGLLQFGFYDRVVGAPAADTGYVTSNASGIICVKTVALQNLDKIGFHACSMEENDKVSISNGVITNISNLKNYSTEDYCGVIK